MKREKITIELRSDPEDSGVLSAALEAFLDELGIAQNVKYDILIASDEVFANIYMHGYEKRTDGRIEFSAQAEGDAITIEFIDHAPRGFPSGRDISLPADVFDSDGGFGLFIIHKLMDEVRVSRAGSANRLVMKKNITAKGGSG